MIAIVVILDMLVVIFLHYDFDHYCIGLCGCEIDIVVIFITNSCINILLCHLIFFSCDTNCTINRQEF